MKHNAAVLVELASLVELPEVQVRSKTDGGFVKRFAQAMRAGAEFPPVRVGIVDNVLYLVDGFHRVAAAKSLRERHIAAEVRDFAALEEARWWGVAGNLTHGQPLKARERRDAFRAYVDAGQHLRGGVAGDYKSYRDMMRDLGGIPHTTIRNWMSKDYPADFHAIGGDDGDAPGGLPEGPSRAELCFLQAADCLDQALAAVPGIDDPLARGALLEKVEALKAALSEACGEGCEPF